MHIKCILCPTDFSEASDHAVDQATTIARYYRSRIAALHVLSPFALTAPGLSGVGPDIRSEELRRQAARQFSLATAQAIDVDVFVDIGQPTSTILERASTLPADLIVIGTHGTSGFQRLMLGSVTEKVLRKATCPVLTVAPRTETHARVPFERLLCGVDFSDASLTAVRAALSLAQESGATLTLLHVLEWPWEEPPPPTWDELPGHSGWPWPSSGDTLRKAPGCGSNRSFRTARHSRR